MEGGLVALARRLEGGGGGEDGDARVRTTGEVDEGGEDELVADLVFRAADGHHGSRGDDAIRP